ncbi:hypothetical protein Ciccas_012079, partial [Cichlidogyrus casuarinus]
MLQSEKSRFTVHRVVYLLIVSTMQMGLIYLGIRRYLDFKAKAFDPKFGGGWSHFGMNFALGCILAAITSFSIFVFLSLIRSSNFASECIKIGRDTDYLSLVGNGSLNVNTANHQTKNNAWTSKKSTFPACCDVRGLLWKRLKQNFLPASGFLHVVIALALLMPISVLEGQEISRRAAPD